MDLNKLVHVSIGAGEHLIKQGEFALDKYSPEISMWTSILTGVAAFAEAIVATLKVEPVIDETKKNVESIHKMRDSEQFPDYGEKEAKKDLAKTYLKTGVEVGKLYLPAVALEAASIGTNFNTHKILNDRNIAMTAAYTTLKDGFDAYRKNVVEKLGEEADKDFRYGTKTEKITEETTDENGKTKKTKKDEKVSEKELKVYSRYFDNSENGSKYYDSESGWAYNNSFLMGQERYLNLKLKRDHFLFLNDVLKELGFPVVKEGQVLGWIYDPTDKNCECYISLHIDEAYKKYIDADGEEKLEKVLRVDIEPDGNILAKVEDYQRHPNKKS